MLGKKVHLRADSANGVHTKFTVFINEVNTGQLCMLENDALYFHGLVLTSNYKTSKDLLYSSGKWFVEDK